MVDLSVQCAGLSSPNPFWLGSGPATQSAAQVARAFRAGWGGAVWKTLGAPGGSATPERPLEEALKDVAQVKQDFPAQALLVSLQADSREGWQALVLAAEGTGCDGLELCLVDFTQPDAVGAAVAAVKEVASKPVLVKLEGTGPDAVALARAAVTAGADGIVIQVPVPAGLAVDLESLAAHPSGTLPGQSVKPLVLGALARLAADGVGGKGLVTSGGVVTWRDAAEMLALGAGAVQVTSAVMRQGVGILGGLAEGLADFLDGHGLSRPQELLGRAKVAGPDPVKRVAMIEPARCIGCGLCFLACRDGAVACIRLPEGAALEAMQTALVARKNAPPAARVPWVDQTACTGCAVCVPVCPVPACLTLEVPVAAPPAPSPLPPVEDAEEALPEPPEDLPAEDPIPDEELPEPEDLPGEDDEDWDDEDEEFEDEDEADEEPIPNVKPPPEPVES